MVEVTPATARTAASAALRTGSQACTTAVSTVIEKALYLRRTMSEGFPVFSSGVPSGLLEGSREPRLSSKPSYAPLQPRAKLRRAEGTTSMESIAELSTP